jgi:hypothetical protein
MTMAKVTCEIDKKIILGVGVFASVFGGKLNGIPVAVKRMELIRLDPGETIPMRTLNHPNLVRLLHVKDDDDFR